MRVVMLFPSLLLLSWMTSLVAAQVGRTDEPADEVRKLEQRFNEAIVEGDVAFFNRILAEDFTHTSQSGKFRTRAEWMKGREQGKSSYQSFETEDVQIRIYGDTAIVTGRSDAKWREAEAQPQSGQYRFLRVWVRRDHGWQAVAFQSTAVTGGRLQK